MIKEPSAVKLFWVATALHVQKRLKKSRQKKKHKIDVGCQISDLPKSDLSILFSEINSNLFLISFLEGSYRASESLRHYLKLTVKSVLKMAKTILIPIDFNIESLNT